jgi:predicted nucleic-acid-binding protein
MTWQKSKADFADCFILASVSAVSENPLATFDTTLGKLEGRKQL